jgi:hypothetical protein
MVVSGVVGSPGAISRGSELHPVIGGRRRDGGGGVAADAEAFGRRWRASL